MTIKFFLLCCFLFLLIDVHGQVSIKNPQICHDNNNFLSCYNDGINLLRFGNGNFKEYRSSDSLIKYADETKTFSFINKRSYPQISIDTISIKLLPHSIEFKNNGKKISIDSLKNLETAIADFPIQTFTNNKIIKGLSFTVDTKWIEIELWDWDKNWSWNITIKNLSNTFLIKYNGFRNNKVEMIYAYDENLKHGTCFYMTFKTLEKLTRVESIYYNRFDTLSTTTFRQESLANYYKYEYNRKGILERDKVNGELKICGCN